MKSLSVSRVELASLVLAIVALFLIMPFKLLAPLLAGLLVFEVINRLSAIIERLISYRFARWIAVALIAIAVVGGLGAALTGAFSFALHEFNNPGDRLKVVFQVIDQARQQLPSVITNHLPSSSTDLYELLQHLAKAHVSELRLWGREALHLFVTVLIGMVLGAVIALLPTPDTDKMKPLAAALYMRVSQLATAFHRVVFAQIKISLVNTILSALFLLVALPLAGVHLPLAKTLVLVTFIFGLLPVIGNLMSNVIICVIGLSMSLWIGVAVLVYLILIHKLEYFLNARIVGGEISARAWELLIAMLVFEAIFGMPGVIAAPIYYAYVKMELRDLNLV